MGNFERPKEEISSRQLAILGGMPIFPNGPPSWPLNDKETQAALERCWSDGSWGRYHGPNCRELAQELAKVHEIEHVTLCSSGTVAVELALRGLKIGAGDEVILAGYDFAGNFRAIEAVGALPVLADIEPATWCLSTSSLDEAFGPSVRAVLVSHLHGGIADMVAICDWAAARGVTVIEDACQAPGAQVHGRIAGAWGDVGVLSFGGSKLLTAGRGGALLTRHADVQQRIKVVAHRGNDAYPLSELQAAVLVPQLHMLSERNQKRRENVVALQQLTSDLAWLHPLVIRPETQPSFYKLAWRLELPQADGVDRDRIVEAIQTEGVAIDSGFRGFTRRSSRRCRVAGSLENSLTAAEQTVTLHHPVLLADQQTIQSVGHALRKVGIGLGLD